MRLDALRFRNLGAFGAEGITVEGLRPGLNVIAERNERGKSSLLAGLELLLFANHKATGKIVTSLSRDDGASPEGEIDFTFGGTEYRLVKRFRAGKSAELIDRRTGQVIARRGDAEERLADMLGAAGKAQGPSGLLWVRQGTSMSPISDDGHVAARLETELSTLVGGDRARDYLTQVENRLGEYRTGQGRAKKHGPIDLAQQALDTAQAELAMAKQAARNIRDTNRALANVTAKLTQLEEGYDPEVASEKLKAAQEKLTAAKAADDKRRAAQSEVKRLDTLAERATETLTTFNEACLARDASETEKTALTAQLTDLDRAHAAAKTAHEAAKQTVSDLYEAREQAAQQEKLRHDQESLTERNAQLQALLETLELVENKAAARADLIAEKDALPPITPDDLNTLLKLERHHDDVKARREQLSVPLIFEADGAGTLTLDGVPVKSGPITLSAGSRLAIEGIGTLRLNHPDSEQLDREAAQIQDQITNWYATFEVSSAREANAQMQARADLDRDLMQLTAELRAIAPNGRDQILDQKERLETEVETLAARLGAADEIFDEEADPADQLAQLGAAKAQLDAAWDQLSEIDRKRATLTERRHAAEQKLSIAAAQTDPQHRDAHRATLTTEALKADQAAAQAREALAALAGQATSDPAMIEADIERLTMIQTNHAKERETLIIEKARLEAERQAAFERRDPDAEVGRLTDQVEQLSTELARHEREADALTLLRDTLVQSQQALQDHYTAPVRKELLPLLRQVIDGADLVLSEQLGATGLVRDGQDDALERLSGGTQEQIAVLTRLAFARLLARGGQPCPVILDDALVYADDQRREQMFTVLNHVATPNPKGEAGLQLLYLSCHENATRGLGGHRLTLERWAAD